MMSFAVLSLAACSKTVVAPSEGAGFVFVTVKPATADYLVLNDRDAAINISANNQACRKAPACKKD